MVFFLYIGGGPWSIIISVAVSALSLLFRNSGSDDLSLEEDWAYDQRYAGRRAPRPRGLHRDRGRGPGRAATQQTGSLSPWPPPALACFLILGLLGVVAYGFLLLSRPELATNRASQALLRWARDARAGLLRLRDNLGAEWHFQWGDAPGGGGGGRRRRFRAKRDEVTSLPTEHFLSSTELLKWSPSQLKDELRRLQISADMQLGRFSGGVEARSMHHFLRAGGVVEKAELVEAVMKARGGESGQSCAICMAEYASGDELRVLPCGHRFHCECVDKWLVDQSKTCPLCSKQI